MRKLIYLVISLFFLISLWSLLTKTLDLPSYLFPSPEVVYASFSKNIQLLSENWLITLVEAIGGFTIANVFSLTIVLLVFRFSFMEEIILPYAVILETIPVIAFAPILVLWLGSGRISHIIAAGLISFFPSLINLVRGVKSINNEYLDFFRLYSASRYQIIRRLVLPASLPYIFSSLKISISLAIVGALVSEFITVNGGLGYIIISGYYTFDIPLVFSAIFLSSTTGILFYSLISILEDFCIPWSMAKTAN